MPSPTTQSTTHTNKRERQSCGAPHGTRAVGWREFVVWMALLYGAAFLGGGVYYLQLAGYL